MGRYFDDMNLSCSLLDPILYTAQTTYWRSPFLFTVSEYISSSRVKLEVDSNTLAFLSLHRRFTLLHPAPWSLLRADALGSTRRRDGPHLGTQDRRDRRGVHPPQPLPHTDASLGRRPYLDLPGTRHPRRDRHQLTPPNEHVGHEGAAQRTARA